MTLSLHVRTTVRNKNHMAKTTKPKIEKFTQYRATSADGLIQVTAGTEKQAIKLLKDKINEKESEGKKRKSGK